LASRDEKRDALKSFVTNDLTITKALALIEGKNERQASSQGETRSAWRS
jgi:hypothetical protein